MACMPRALTPAKRFVTRSTTAGSAWSAPAGRCRTSTSATPCSAPSPRIPRLLGEPGAFGGSPGRPDDEVKTISDAFADGDVRRALELTPDEVADRLMLAGTPEDWIQWLSDTYAPAGLNHALVSFTDPFTLQSWAGLRVDGLPSLCEQVRMVGEEVLPALA